MRADVPAQRYIVVEGPIGVGKTSLAQRSRKRSRRSWCSSRTRRIPSSNASIATRKSGALPAQLFFLFQRAQQLGTLKQQDLFAPRRVADYLFEKDRLFAGLTLDAAEMALYEQVAVAPRRRSAEAGPGGLPAGAGGSAAAADREARHRLREPASTPPISRGSTMPTRASSTSTTSAPLLIVNAANIDPVQNQADYDELVGAIRRMKKGRMYYNPLRHGTI